LDRKKLETILKSVRRKSLPVGKALSALRHFPYEDLGFAKLDTHRALRKGFPEVIFCQGKSPEQVARLFVRMVRHGPVIATRAGGEVYETVKASAPGALYHSQARIISNVRPSRKKASRFVLVVSAGTADGPVAEEAATTAELMGVRVERLWDVGVAGLHRLLDRRQLLFGASVLIVVAGMEGALASVVAGLVAKPVIAVPTSVGYGASFKGLAALLSMLNCCAPGVSVVNIDNGFGAGYLAAMMLKGK
jgi:NCAIR mutase (PurE)-related protein